MNKSYFPNLCTRDNTPEIVKKNNIIMTKELMYAGIKAEDFGMVFDNREVKTSVYGTLATGDTPDLHWCFGRAWQYWIAKGPAVPYEVAKIIYESEHRDECTACGSSFKPDEMGGFGVDCYHVFTDEALKFLTEQLNSVYENHKKRLEMANGNSES